jgi:hypothetical protein
MLTWSRTDERRMTMVWPKACPHCHGDLIRDLDLDGPYVGCIQCGRALSESQERTLLGLSTVRPNRKVASYWSPVKSSAGNRAA